MVLCSATLRLTLTYFWYHEVNNLILFDYKLITRTYLMLSIVNRLILRALAFTSIRAMQ